jgi:hypothetical protein
VVKPEFFEYREKEKEAWGTVHDVRNWVVRRNNIHVRAFLGGTELLIDCHHRMMMTGEYAHGPHQR